MVEQRVVRDETGKVTGYREVSSLLYIERTKREVAERSESRAMTKKASSALELWAKWRSISTGYGDSPLANTGNPRVPPRSAPPAGCHEAPEAVLKVIKVMADMFNGSPADKRYAKLLHTVYLGRQNNETIKQAIVRLKLNTSSSSADRAIRQFAKLFFM